MHQSTNAAKRDTLRLLLALLPLLACHPPREIIVVFHAASLDPLVRRVANRFEQNHPRVIIHHESSNSLDAIRKVVQAGKPCDLIAVADYRLIERFLPSSIRPGYIFLGNELVLGAARGGIFDNPADKSDWESRWQEKLPSGRYSYGIADPDHEPAGYYTHLAWKLAEIHHNRPGLYRALLNHLETRWIRPESSELVTLLQTGALDFAFLYRSTALQNNLRFITLPAEISLVEDSYADLYSRVFTQVRGDSPDARFEVTGVPIRYGVALANPSNPWARRLLDFLLSPEVQELYRELGYTSVPIVEAATATAGVPPSHKYGGPEHFQ